MKNQNTWLIFGSILIVTSCTLFKSNRVKLESIPNETVEKYAKTIQVADLKKHLTILASDAYEGRETAMPGQKKAAEYIKNHFQSISSKIYFGQGNYGQPKRYNLPNRQYGNGNE